MHFSVEVKVRGCLCIATKGSLYGDQCRLFGVFAQDVAVIIMVLSTVCDNVLCTRYAATCWLTLLATVRLAVVSKGPLWDGSTCTGQK